MILWYLGIDIDTKGGLVLLDDRARHVAHRYCRGLTRRVDDRLEWQPLGMIAALRQLASEAPSTVHIVAAVERATAVRAPKKGKQGKAAGLILIKPSMGLADAHGLWRMACASVLHADPQRPAPATWQTILPKRRASTKERARMYCERVLCWEPPSQGLADAACIAAWLRGQTAQGRLPL